MLFCIDRKQTLAFGSPLAKMESSLVNWVKTFEGVEVAALDEFSDGVVLHLILQEIAPSHFGEGLLKDNCGSNAILKATNVKKLLRALEVYYKEALLQEMDMEFVDASKVAQSDAAEISKLVELVLGCAVQCDDKHRYIERLMKDLDKQSQADLMVLTKNCLRYRRRYVLFHRRPSLSERVCVVDYADMSRFLLCCVMAWQPWRAARAGPVGGA